MTAIDEARKEFACEHPLEEMVHYPSDKMVYQKDAKFIPVSINNILRMNVLDNTDDFVFTVKGNLGRSKDKKIGWLKRFWNWLTTSEESSVDRLIQEID